MAKEIKIPAKPRDDEQTLFTRGLRYLVDASTGEWSGKQTDLYAQIRDTIKARPLGINEFEELQADWAKKKAVEIDHRTPIFLPRLESEPDYLPLLMLQWSFGKKLGQRTIRLKLVRSDATSATKFRIASMHLDAQNDAPFSYMHLQLTERATKTFSKFYSEDPALPNPKKLPRIPLPATCSGELLLCAMVGLYGTHAPFINKLQRALTPTPCPLMKGVFDFAIA